MDGAKRKRDYESGADVIASALSRMEDDAPPPASAGRGPPFVPAAAFAGARAGYYFGRGAQGVGYYADARGAGAAASAAMPPPQPRSAAALVRCLSRARRAAHCTATAQRSVAARRAAASERRKATTPLFTP